jgi:membrane-anchored protein YejM (alkaline phosphatase superfamily)
MLTFALVYRAAAPRRVGTVIAVLPFAASIGVHAMWRPSAEQQHARDRYAVYNPSFRVTDGLLREQPQSSSFDRYLRANTGLTDLQVEPVTIDFARPLTTPARPPHMFLFVVDSLRADYLSPYNAAVRFTPRIAEFAADNLTLHNAFTRYGGTGLSMPAIWAGSVLAHKQYVLPFASMNTLEKLVDANGYLRIQTHDHITEALWSHTDRDIELDRGRTEMDFDFCRTVDELGTRLGELASDPRPVFAQTRSLNLHVAEVRNGYVPPDRSYPGFEAPYAYRVERIDGCFGSFIERLEQLHLYDRSIVVLTADHGELIGEDGRWGHSYHLFPQVVQVPMFVHLPASIDTRSVDTNAVSLSTDLTPTIYTALGLQVTPPDMLAGHSLLDRTAALERRRTPLVLSASYGAVYAVISRNGRRLYIADAIHEQEYAYERRTSHDMHWSEVPVTPGRRVLEQLRIRRHVDRVARTYGLDRPF